MRKRSCTLAVAVDHVIHPIFFRRAARPVGFLKAPPMLQSVRHASWSLNTPGPFALRAWSTDLSPDSTGTRIQSVRSPFCGSRVDTQPALSNAGEQEGNPSRFQVAFLEDLLEAVSPREILQHRRCFNFGE